MSAFEYRPISGPILVLFADDEMLIVDKPAGLLSVPGRGEDRADCVIARLAQRWPNIRLVHRLDLDTSGVMVFALTPAAQGNISQQFEKRMTAKRYIARVEGALSPDTGRVDAPLMVDWPNRPRQMIHPDGKPSRTDWRVIGRSEAETRVQLTPVTGRSHQLRVHMASTGHAILGDTLYASGAARDDWPRLMLHAHTLRLKHPVDGDWRSFAAPLPF